MTDLSQLLEKVRTAEAGSRELDLEFWRLFDLKAPEAIAAGKEPLPWLWMVTTSLDAIVALIERELPGWNIQQFKNSEGWMARLRSPRFDLFCTNVVDGVEMRVPTGPLALCAAFLSALISKEKADG